MRPARPTNDREGAYSGGETMQLLIIVEKFVEHFLVQLAAVTRRSDVVGGTRWQCCRSFEPRQRRCGSLAAGLREDASTSGVASLTALQREDRWRRADASYSERLDRTPGRSPPTPSQSCAALPACPDGKRLRSATRCVWQQVAGASTTVRSEDRISAFADGRPYGVQEWSIISVAARWRRARV
jgi:hypothetical protein